MAPNFPNF